MGASSAGANAEKASRDASSGTIAHAESDAEWKSDTGAFANGVADSITQ